MSEELYKSLIREGEENNPLDKIKSNVDFQDEDTLESTIKTAVKNIGPVGDVWNVVDSFKKRTDPYDIQLVKAKREKFKDIKLSSKLGTYNSIENLVGTASGMMVGALGNGTLANMSGTVISNLTNSLGDAGTLANSISLATNAGKAFRTTSDSLATVEEIAAINLANYYNMYEAKPGRIIKNRDGKFNYITGDTDGNLDGSKKYDTNPSQSDKIINTINDYSSKAKKIDSMSSSTALETLNGTMKKFKSGVNFNQILNMDPNKATVGNTFIISGKRTEKEAKIGYSVDNKREIFSIKNITDGTEHRAKINRDKALNVNQATNNGIEKDIELKQTMIKYRGSLFDDGFMKNFAVLNNVDKLRTKALSITDNTEKKIEEDIEKKEQKEIEAENQNIVHNYTQIISLKRKDRESRLDTIADWGEHNRLLIKRKEEEATTGFVTVDRTRKKMTPKEFFNSISNSDENYKSFLERRNKKIGGLYIEPYFSDGNIKADFIPFEFNPIINDGGLEAKYSTEELMGRILSVRSYVGTDSSTLTLETKYLATAGKNDKTNEVYSNEIYSNSWENDWNVDQLMLIENQYRKLVMPFIKGGIFVRPPIVRIKMWEHKWSNIYDDNKNFQGRSPVETIVEADDTFVNTLFSYPLDKNESSALEVTYSLDGFVNEKRYIVTNVSINPIDSEDFSNAYRIDNKVAVRRGFTVSLTMAETTKNFLDTVPNYYHYDNHLKTIAPEEIYERKETVRQLDSTIIIPDLDVLLKSSNVVDEKIDTNNISGDNISVFYEINEITNDKPLIVKAFEGE